MAFGLTRSIFRMAASAAILLSATGPILAEVCDKAYKFDYSDLAPVNAASEFLMIVVGPIGGLVVFFVGLYLTTSKAGVLLGLSLFLGLIGLSEILMPRDDVIFAYMIEEGCAPAYSAVGPVFLAIAISIAIFAAFAIRRRTSSA
ncbi:hypothetical protein [Rhizobium herbae]|uniref:DoxX family protein n=1 Tax=Rhizobium herbae TaxID=508661 RepID=A0ABS4EIS9_9HYPH|nr:hypothetical protein [Rhizobium herbae]MBP1857846.1 hypothetical protein [Rhizobium herbae]